MTGLVRKATLLSACGLLLAGSAMAGIPNAANSQAPCIIVMDFPNSDNTATLQGTEKGVCAVPALKVIVRDALNVPVANSDVVVDFSACGATEGRISDVQADLDVTVACGGRTVLKTTNALGEVCFSIEGTSANAGTFAGLVVCAKVYASGNLLGTRTVIGNTYDLPIANGVVDSGDRSVVLDREGQPYDPYADFDCNGTVDSGDRSLMLDAEGNAAAGVVLFTGTLCP